LKGGVIASSDTAIENGLNSLSTATLTHTDIAIRASYSGSSMGISGGYGGDNGKTQKGTATNVNLVPGTALPAAVAVSMALPVVLSASGDARNSVRTRSNKLRTRSTVTAHARRCTQLSAVRVRPQAVRAVVRARWVQLQAR
jgi:hypothetical protein